MLEISALSLKASVVAAPGSSPGDSLGGDLIQLHAAFGQDEANYGAARYSVDNEGLIQVPLEAVGPLTTIGGFVLVTTGDNAISAGALALHHDDAAGCSYAGVNISAIQMGTCSCRPKPLPSCWRMASSPFLRRRWKP
jgi:hypothetical protein